jgi:hypothetical protein
MEMVAQKSIITSQYPNDFLGACNYFSAQVSRLHAGAQLENSKYKNKRNISAMQGRGGGRDGSRAEVAVILEVEVDLAVAVMAVAVMAVAMVDMAMVMAAALRSMVSMSQIRLALLLMRNGNSLLGTAVVSMSLRLVKG